MRILKFLVKAFLIIVLCQIVLVSLLVMATQTKIFGNLPLVSNYQPFVVLSGSMEPTLKVGSVVVIQKVNPAAVKEGDIITFNSPINLNQQQTAEKTPTTHRVNRVLDENGVRKFETKGDANNDVDAYHIGEGDVVGMASFDVPYLGYTSHFLRGKTGLLVLIGVAFAVILFEAGNIVVRLWGRRYASSY